MRKTNLIISLAFLVCFSIIFSSFKKMLTSGAPPGHTGAPGEETCARAGCHDGNLPNTGSGNISVFFGNGSNFYEPGKTYTVTISLNQDSIYRFGFETTLLRNDSNLAAGTIITTDNVRTQKMNGPNQYTGREYITYRYDGTSPVSPGMGQWSFDWVAPSVNAGNLTLYVAAVAANNDATDAGDLTYTASLEIEPQSVTSANSENFEQKKISVFPNPVKDNFTVSYHVDSPSPVVFELQDITGKKSKIIFKEFKIQGDYRQLINLTNEYSTGTYLLKISIGKSVEYKKINFIR